MYLREDTRKNKDGQPVTYVRLAHNVRDPKRGHSKANIIHNFGRKENLNIPQLKRLIKSISRYLPPAEALEVQAQIQNRGRQLKWKNCRTYGGAYFVAELLKKLNFQQLLGRHIQDRQFTTPINQAIVALVANRCLAPQSKLAVVEWVSKNVWYC
jgi:hypothetical protein